MTKRVGIISLLHESNTFVTQPTTLDQFVEDTLVVGEPMRQQLADTHHEIGGFFAGLAEERIRAVPILAARALPYGPITSAAYSMLLEMLFRALATVGPLDGILVAPHGATVSQSYADADGHWLGELRKRVGPQFPIIGTLDSHANLSQQMVSATDALVAYRSNPHLDQHARGLEAAMLMVRTLRGEIRPTQAAVFPPLAINIERQRTDEPHLRPLYELADGLFAETGALSNSILLGFPYADVAEMGSAVLAIADANPILAQQHADLLADYLWSHRSDFTARLIGIDEALRRAARLDGPICLLDMGDNVGGGSPADSTHLAHAISTRGIGPAFVCLYDPQAVGIAAAAGVGANLELDLGGKTDSRHGEPLRNSFTVVGLHDGKFQEPLPRHGGFAHCDQGQTAIVTDGENLTVMLTSRRMPPFSLRQLTSCDVDPSTFHVLIAKGVNAPVAAYEPVCRHLIRVNTPGCTSADMTEFKFAHRRRPMFPFEEDCQWHR